MAHECPSCSTPVEVGKKDTYIICPYCGILIEVNGDDLEEYEVG